MQQTENQRLKIIMYDLGFKTQKLFANILGLTPGGLSDILREKPGVGVSDAVKRVLENSYNVNIDWLETGEGEMYMTRKPEDRHVNSAFVENIEKTNVIPIYDIEIDAGNVTRLIDDHNDVPIVGHFYLKDSINSTGLIGVRAKGNSMSHFIDGGDVMLIRRVEDGSFIALGHAYVIVGKKNAVVKYLRNGPDDATWTLRSHNTDYEDFIIKKADVVHLFMVVKVLKELAY